MDTSVSQQNLVHQERTAGYRFFEKVLRVEKDLAFLMSFDIDVELLQDLTASKTLLLDGLERLQVQGNTARITPGTVPRGGGLVGTAMFDSVFLAAEEVLKPEAGRKALVLISDGYDAGSKIDLDGAIEAALRADTIIFAVRYYDPYFWRGQTVIGGGDGDLKRMARYTGGQVYEVRRKRTLDWIFDDIDAIVRNQYSIGYTPKRDLSELGFRKIELKLKNKRHKALTREGYYPSEK